MKMLSMHGLVEVTETSVYEKFTPNTLELSEAYAAARLAVYKAAEEPTGLTDALVRLHEDHRSGVLRPPLPSVLASTIEDVVINVRRDDFDVVGNVSHQNAAKALLDVATRFEILRFATDPSWEELKAERLLLQGQRLRAK